MRLSNREWATFLEARKSGDFTIARSGWLADYNDPIAFLDMWTTNSENNDAAIGKNKNATAAVYSLDLSDVGMSEYNKSAVTWKESYDLLIRLIREESDKKKRYALMHKAEDLLMESGCVTPLYYYTDMFMLDSRVSGFYTNPLGVKYFMYCTLK